MLAMLKWLIIFAFILVMAGFSVVNRHFVTLEFYPLPYQWELPVYLLMLGTFLLGFLMAWLAARLHMLRLRHRIRQAEHKSDALRDEVSRLRHQPLPKN